VRHAGHGLAIALLIEDGFVIAGPNLSTAPGDDVSHVDLTAAPQVLDGVAGPGSVRPVLRARAVQGVGTNDKSTGSFVTLHPRMPAEAGGWHARQPFSLSPCPIVRQNEATY
jgi:hypothetical protein